MSNETRPYRKRKRAQKEEQTRQRITEAVVELHRTVGPARTKVTEVAERAGVSRRTVYNHFPTEADLIEACSTHWAAANPFPDPAAWLAIEDPRERLRRGLADLYAFYGRTEDMMGNVLRDAPIVEPLEEIMERRWAPYVEAVVDVLTWRRDGADADEIRAAVRVAVDFRTWRLLRDATPGPSEAVRVGAKLVDGVASPRGRDPLTR